MKPLVRERFLHGLVKISWRLNEASSTAKKQKDDKGEVTGAALTHYVFEYESSGSIASGTAGSWTVTYKHTNTALDGSGEPREFETTKTYYLNSAKACDDAYHWENGLGGGSTGGYGKDYELSQGDESWNMTKAELEDSDTDFTGFKNGVPEDAIEGNYGKSSTEEIRSGMLGAGFNPWDGNGTTTGKIVEIAAIKPFVFSAHVSKGYYGRVKRHGDNKPDWMKKAGIPGSQTFEGNEGRMCDKLYETMKSMQVKNVTRQSGGNGCAVSWEEPNYTCDSCASKFDVDGNPCAAEVDSSHPGKAVFYIGLPYVIKIKKEYKALADKDNKSTWQSVPLGSDGEDDWGVTPSFTPPCFKSMVHNMPAIHIGDPDAETIMMGELSQSLN